MRWHGIERTERREHRGADAREPEQARPHGLSPIVALASGNPGAPGRTLALRSRQRPALQSERRCGRCPGTHGSMHRPRQLHVAMIGTTTPAQQRIRAAAVLALLGVTACSGGGGGPPPDAAPVLVTAAFVGAGPAPAVGDNLILTFSEQVG